ncbi:MAG: penicillin-binding protein 2 [Lachnospiraceae bacterium]|nr:penicillin-binding protein 2 [Lachnospiraceae bacterium]
MTPMNKTRVRHITYLVMAVFFAMVVYLCAYASVYNRKLFDNDYNIRPAMLLQENVRGSIYSADGQTLACSTVSADGGDERTYPYGRLFSHIVGFSILGKSGIEDLEDYDLVRSGVALSSKAKLSEEETKYPGNNVTTTLDTRLQQAASDALGNARGAVVVTDPKSGRILAMVSKPDFDPNTIGTDWETYLQDDTSGILLNRATQGLYPPGSTFKIVDVMEYLSEHEKEENHGMDSYHFSCSGVFEYDGETIHCFHHQSHGEVDFRQSFALSCNSSFANIGTTLNKRAYTSFLKKLLFDEELPYALPSTKSHVKLGANATSEELIQLSIGQGETGITPLHLNMITASIANEGRLMRPYVVEKVETADGKRIRAGAPKLVGRVLQEDDAQIMTDLMREVVLTGTATALRTDAYAAAGKTGSAEYDPDDPTKSHAWFTGFAPADDPQICITIIIEGAGSGGGVAVPAAKTIFDTYFTQVAE